MWLRVGSRCRKLFAKEQRAFYSAHAPAGLSFDDLVPLGPVFILKAVFGVVLSATSKLEHKFVAEVWTYPDGSRIVELSTKCQPSEAFEVGVEMRSYMADRGIPLVGGQQTKTRAAMKFFGAELAAAKGD